MNPHKILRGSSVCQNSAGMLMDYMFVDNNKGKDAKCQMEQFQRAGAILIPGGNCGGNVCEVGSHCWAASAKGRVIKYAIDNSYAVSALVGWCANEY